MSWRAVALPSALLSGLMASPAAAQSLPPAAPAALRAGAGQCLAPAAAPANGTTLALAACEGAPLWTFAAGPNGFTLRSGAFCLDGGASGTTPILWRCDGSNEQLWNASGTGLTNRRFARCLEAGGSAATLAACTGSAAQGWTAFTGGSPTPPNPPTPTPPAPPAPNPPTPPAPNPPTPTPTPPSPPNPAPPTPPATGALPPAAPSALRAGSGQCLAPAAQPANGTTLALATCEGAPLWTFASGPNGFTVRSGNFCLDGGATGTAPILWACDGSNEQLWNASGAGVANRRFARCLEAGGSAATLAACAGSAAQSWAAFTGSSPTPTPPSPPTPTPPAPPAPNPPTPPVPPTPPAPNPPTPPNPNPPAPTPPTPPVTGALPPAAPSALRAGSGQCLAPAASPANGTTLALAACEGAPLWTFASGPNGFTVRSGNFCVDGGATGTAPILWACDGSNEQLWNTSGTGLTNRRFARCLEAGGSAATLAACTGSAAQSWAAFTGGSPTTPSPPTPTPPTPPVPNPPAPPAPPTPPTPAPETNRIAVSIRVSEASGWFAKDVFLFTRDAAGAVASQTTLVSYNFEGGVPGMNVPTTPAYVAAGTRWGLGLRVWPNQDKSRSGTPTLHYEDTPNQTVLASSGNCSSGTRQDSWGDSGAPGRHMVYALTCRTVAGTGGNEGGNNPGGGTPGGNEGGNPPGGGALPGETPPTEPTLIVNRRSGACFGAASGQAGLGLRQLTCADTAADNWRFVPAAGGYQIRNAASGLCATLSAANGNDGTRLNQAACSATDRAQLFRLQKLENWYNIVSVASNRCVSPLGGNNNRDHNSEIVEWTCDGADPQRWTLSVAKAPGQWSDVVRLGIVPSAAATLPSGKILMWSANARDNFQTSAGAITHTVTYDPATNRSTDRVVATTGHDMFCPGVSTLPDGRILIAGGQTDTRTTIYDPETDTWSVGARMNVGRGYNGMTTLSTGEALTVGGSWSGARGGKVAEVWSPSTGAWRRLNAISGESIAARGIDVYRGDNYAWLFPLAGGNVFHAGPSSEMNWLRTSGNGEIRPAGRRADDLFANNGNAVMYEPGRIAVFGGASDQTNAPGRDGVFTIDITGGFGVDPAVQRRAPMAFPRAFANTVVLPNGETVTVGGQNFALEFTDDRPVMIPELWSPASGTFTRLPPLRIPRTYHSFASLMLDGRVAVGGGGLCGNCGTNHPDMEILTPPYLLDAGGRPAPRPALVQAGSTFSAGGTLSAQTDRAVSAFSLVRLSTVTHSANADQRRVPLEIRSRNGSAYELGVSAAGAAQLLPGPWMLFALDEAGVPSVARIVRVR